MLKLVLLDRKEYRNAVVFLSSSPKGEAYKTDIQEANSGFKFRFICFFQ